MVRLVCTHKSNPNANSLNIFPTKHTGGEGGGGQGSKPAHFAQ
jgi:hypothetical protein